MKTIHRLGVFDHGETAVRVLNAVGDLNHARLAPAITTVLIHRDADPQPWYGREADDVQRLPGGAGPCREADIVDALQRASAARASWSRLSVPMRPRSPWSAAWRTSCSVMRLN